MKKPQALIGLLAALGTAIGVMVAVIGLPYGRADYSAFAELYHGTAFDTAELSTLRWTRTSPPRPPSPTRNVPVPGPATVAADVTVAQRDGRIDVGRCGQLQPASLIAPVRHRASTRSRRAACPPPGTTCNPDFSESGLPALPAGRAAPPVTGRRHRRQQRERRRVVHLVLERRLTRRSVAGDGGTG